MVTKEEAKEELKKLVELFTEGQRYWSTKSESDIGFHFIEPLFEKVLGWKRIDITKEERVLNKRADYIMRIGNEGMLVVEAKKTDISLSDDEGRQVVSYAYHKKIKFAVLTNFKHLIVYHALSNIKNVGKNQLKIGNSYFKLNFEELVEKFDDLWLLSRESFEKKEINKLLSAKDEKLYKPIDEHILEDLLKIREWLSKELKTKKPYLENQIDEIVQIIIDRLIFIRCVEDRDLEQKNYLKLVETQVRNQDVKLQLFPYLLEKFRYFNERYDSRLFEPGLLEKEGSFSDEVLRKVILALYSGVSGELENYQFDKIPGDLFGSIYEQYLGTILQSTEKRVKLDKESGKRKKMGIYYTPAYIVDYIVKNTVGEYLKDKTIDEILEVDIVDPACGSGSFLIRAFKEVCSIVEKKLEDGDKSTKYASFTNHKGKLNFSQKITILKNCIYGVDLDEKAVELAHLNLMLTALENETNQLKNRKLPEMNKNLKNGNSLIDDPKVAGDKAFTWQAQFPDVFRGGGFDVVIGNPPYDVIYSNDKPKEYNFFKSDKRYTSAEYNPNLFGIFIDKSIDIMRLSGIMGFIVPDTVLTNKYFGNLRRKILLNCSINRIIDLKKGIFSEAVVDTIILTLTKQKIKNNKIFIGNSLNSIETILAEQENFQNSNNNEFNIYFNKYLVGIKERMVKNSVLLGEISKIYRGIVSWDNKKYVTENRVDERFKPLIIGKDATRYYLSYSGHYIQFDKRGVKTGGDKEIHEAKEKILIALITGGMNYRVNAALDDHQYYVLQNYNNLIITEERFNIKYILALLNSRLLNDYYTVFFNDKNIKRIQLMQLPIKKCDLKTQETIASLVNQMLSLQKRYHEEKLSGNEKEGVEQQIKNVDYEIDQEVYKLYGITKEEQKIIEDSLR